MTATGYWRKGLDESRIFGFDWSQRLLAGDIITKSEWYIEGEDGFILKSLGVEANVTRVLVVGGPSEGHYTLSNVVFTQAGERRKASRSVMMVSQ